MNNQTHENEKIKQKQDEIKNYERILKEYESGRWYDQGRRHLASLKKELEELEKPPSTPQSQQQPSKAP